MHKLMHVTVQGAPIRLRMRSTVVERKQTRGAWWHSRCVQTMASKSLTAVTSFVSVAAEKTVIAMRCNTRGFEKVTFPVLAIIAMAGTLALLAVAAGTPVWVQVGM